MIVNCGLLQFDNLLWKLWLIVGVGLAALISSVIEKKSYRVISIFIFGFQEPDVVC